MTFKTAQRYRRQQKLLPLYLIGVLMATCLGCAFTGYWLYNLPFVNERLYWRVEIARSAWRDWTDPRPADLLPTVAPTPFEVRASRPTAAPTVQLQFELRQTPTATVWFTPTLRPFATATPSPTVLVSPTPIPAAYQIVGVPHEYQRWNNCGPSTLAMVLGFWAWSGDQTTTAAVLKPNKNDRNVRPDELAAFAIGTGFLQADVRVGGTLDLLKLLLSNEYPVIIEKGFFVSEEKGWMGHYVPLIGFDDSAGYLIGQDSYEGPEHHYPYADFDSDWQAFNRLFIVIYPQNQAAQIQALLGVYQSTQGSYEIALETARRETRLQRDNPFAWHNLGMTYNYMGDFERASAAFDQARNLGLPWRMLWYQFGLYRAYYEQERYQELLDIASVTLRDAGGQLEESYFWQGSAQLALGNVTAARDSLRQAVDFNPNFSDAQTVINQVEYSLQPTATFTPEPTYAFPSFPTITPFSATSTP
jgi:hypothetical protein